MAVTINGTTGILAPDIGIDGTTLVVDEVNNRIGIATSSPNAKLQIVTDSGARALTVTAPTLGPYITFETGSTAFADIGSEAGLVGSGSNTDMLTFNARQSRSISFRTNSNERLRISADGRIGINATNNTAYDINADDVLIASDGNTGITIRSAGSSPYAMIHFADGTTNNSEKRAGRILYQHDGNNMSFYTNDTQRLRITGSGDMGLGGVIPTSDGGTTFEIYDDTTPTLKLNDGDDYKALLQLRGNDLEIRGSNGVMEFYTGNVDGASSTKRLSITSGGRVGINVDTPENTLHIKNSVAGATSVRIQRNGAANNEDEYASIIFDGSGYTGAKIASHRNHGTWDDRGDLRFYSGYGNDVFTERLRITNTGQVRIPINATATAGWFQLGASQQFSIFQDSANAYLANDDLIISNGAVNQVIARFKNGGAAELYHNGTKRFETISTGVKITSNLYLGGSLNGGLSYNSTADTLEFMMTNGGTHSELTSTAYVPSTNAGKTLGYHNKRWDTLYVNKVAFGGATNTDQHSLDDYEEGSWTPSITGGSGTSARSYYVKVGRKVSICCNISLSSPTNASFSITLPFTGMTSGYTGSSQGVEAHGACMLYSPSPPANTVNACAYCWGGVANIYFTRNGSSWVQATGNQVGSSIQFTATYVAV